jgi:hypothetical protein
LLEITQPAWSEPVRKKTLKQLASESELKNGTFNLKIMVAQPRPTGDAGGRARK